MQPLSRLPGLLRRRKFLISSAITACVLAGTGITIYTIYGQHSGQTAETVPSSSFSVPSATPNKPSSPPSLSDIVTEINNERQLKGLGALNWITQLDTAASARANYMVANNTTSVSAGDPGGDLTDASYYPASWTLSAMWDAKTTSQIVTALTSSDTSDIVNTTSYTDVGLAQVPDMVNGARTNLLLFYFATPQTSNSSSSPSAAPQTCPQGQSGIYPHCIPSYCNDMLSIIDGACIYYDSQP